MPEQIAAPGPQTSVDPQVEARLATVGRWLRRLAAIYASLALLSVVFEPIRNLLPTGPGFVRSLPASAGISLAVLAWGALLAGDIHRPVNNVLWRRLGLVFSAGAVLFGTYVVAVFLVDFPSLWWGGVLAMPAFSVGVVLVLLGLAVLLSVSRVNSRVVWGQVATLLVFSLTAVIFLAYIYGDPSVGRLIRRPEISFQAALVSLMVALGIILMRPGSGLLATASSPGAGGRLLRRLSPVALLLPSALLFVVEVMPTTDRIDAIAFMSVGLGLMMLVLMAVVTQVIDETRMEALTSAAEADRARIGLEQEAPVVSMLSDVLHVVDIGSAGLDVATRFRPGRGSVTGDASAIRLLPDSTVGVVLVDLTGHGAGPAIRAIRVRDLLLHSLARGDTPGEAMSLVGWTAPGDVLASAVVVKLDPETGAAVFASAGHPPAVYVGVQEARLIGPTGPLLYLDPTASFEDVKLDLGPGDSVVLFSDGVADVQRSVDGRPEPEILSEMLLAEGGVAARTADLVLGFAEPDPSDDQSVLVIRREL